MIVEAQQAQLAVLTSTRSGWLAVQQAAALPSPLPASSRCPPLILR